MSAQSNLYLRPDSEQEGDLNTAQVLLQVLYSENSWNGLIFGPDVLWQKASCKWDNDMNVLLFIHSSLRYTFINYLVLGLKTLLSFKWIPFQIRGSFRKYSSIKWNKSWNPRKNHSIIIWNDYVWHRATVKAQLLWKRRHVHGLHTSDPQASK